MQEAGGAAQQQKNTALAATLRFMTELLGCLIEVFPRVKDG